MTMRMYTDVAPWWHLLSHPDDYTEEAGVFARVFRDELNGSLDVALLELGSGGGNNASHMKKTFTMTLADVSPDMIAASKSLNPECEHIVADMRSVRLDRQFDGVFIHDAICYMGTVADLRAAIQTAYAHVRPGGIALLVPDEVAETYAPSTSHGGHDGDDGRSMRYLEWNYRTGETRTATDYVYILREADGSTSVVPDHHELGLFSGSTWLSLLSDAGFSAQMVSYTLSDVDEELTMFVARRPAY